MAVGAALPLGRTLLSPLSTLPGDPRGDLYKHAWSYWHATVAPGLWTEFLNAPEGGFLLDVMWVPSRLMLPVTLVGGPALASNLWVWLSLVLIGVCTWALCRELGGSVWGSLAGGLAAQTSPYLMGYPLYSGVHERLTVWVFPLLVIALLRVGRSGSWRWAALGTLGLFVATVGCQNYGVFAVPLIGLTLPLLRHSQHKKRLAVTLVAMALAVVGVFLLVRWAAEHPQSLAPQPRGVHALIGRFAPGETITLAQLFNPADAAARHHMDELADRLSKLTYVGWIPIVLALGGCLRSRRPVVVGCIAAAALASFGALGRGPVHSLLGWTVPSFGEIPAPWQLLAWVGPLLAVGMAHAVRHPAWAALGLGLILLERILVLPFPLVLPTASAVVSPIYEQIDGDSVVEIPRLLRGEMTAPASVFWAQTVHERPLPIAINVGSTGADKYEPILDAVGNPDPQCLRRGGIRWVVLHQDWLSPQATLSMADPVATDGAIALYDLGPPTPSGFSLPITPGGYAGDVRMGLSPCPYYAPKTRQHHRR